VDGKKLHGAVIFNKNLIYSKVVLGAFAKLWKATVSFVLSVCMEQLDCHYVDFDEI
jgi:hypothetical protein